jgi:phage protein D
MDQQEMEGLVNDINERTRRIEQKLPALAAKSHVARVHQRIGEEAERTRQHFNAVAERIEASVRITKLEAGASKRR